jgi:dinuclear metal center YbgI/SA1388 family protein
LSIPSSACSTPASPHPDPSNNSYRYPSAIADKTWDNTGLLLESPHRSDLVASRPKKHVVLLTIDLTRSVVDEAIALRSSMIITYHPIIFRPMKSLTFADSQQESLLRLAQEGISVYSPHTAVDATIGGVNDWLAEGISGGKANEESREVIEKVNGPEGFEDSGMGRIVVLKEATELGELVKRVKAHLGMEKLMVADGTAGRKIKKLALCAGSGGSMFKNLDVDLFFTGELSHHEALAAKEKGISVISCWFPNFLLS